MSPKRWPGTRAAVLAATLLVAAATLAAGISPPAFATHVEAPLDFGECQARFGFDQRRNAADEKRLVKRATGSLEQEIDTVVEVQSAMRLPYRPPGRPERDRFQCGFDLARSGALGTSASVLDAVGYHVLRSADGRMVMLREQALWPDPRAVDATAYRGWGLYVIVRRGGANVTVEAPHACLSVDGGPPACPGGDDESHRMAVTAFRQATGRYLLVAGAQRQVNKDPRTGTPFDAESCPEHPACADMSHQPHSVFQRVHEAAFESFLVPGFSLAVPAKATYQAHRFAAADHNGDRNPDDDDLKLVVNEPTLDEATPANVVVSNGTGGTGPARSDYPSASGRVLGAAATSHGFRVCVFNGQPTRASVENGTATAQAKADGCGRLGATQNEQGRHLRNENTDDVADDKGPLLHVEVAGEVVEDPAARERLATVIGTTLNALF